MIYAIKATVEIPKAILVRSGLLSFFIAFLEKINAGTTKTYENITCLNTSGIDIAESTKEIIENSFTFSLLNRILHAIFIVAIKSNKPITLDISE